MPESPRVTLGELATRIPAASRVFHAHGLDYCCGGSRHLDEACQPLGLDPEVVLAEIDRAAARASDSSPRWDEHPLADLIDHLLESYHEPLRHELTALVEMAEKVRRRHADKASCPAGLVQHLTTLADDVVSHMEKEEQVHFPLIRSGGGSGAAMQVRVMMEEHDDHASQLGETRRLTEDLTPPAEACPTWIALYLRLEELERNLMQHMHLENNVLFPRALQEPDSDEPPPR